ncbi:reverse transcriptase domain-containing protein [Tanacetum coccineum]
MIREFLWHKAGNGSSISVWHDRWCDISPLSNFISNRDIYREGFTQATKLAEVVSNGHFKWPIEWYTKYPLLNSIAAPILILGARDKLEWKDFDGLMKPFSVNIVWNSIRPRSTKVSWYDFVWFPSCIPRHALNMWLIIKRRLKTQDNLRAWDNVDLSTMSCSLCNLQADSHEHLFFECDFSKQAWSKVKVFVGLPNSSPSIDSILLDIAPFAKRKSSRSIIAKLVVAASSYFIWQERNNRMFKKSKRSQDQVVDCILNAVRLKLMSCKWKKSKAVLDVASLWNLGSICLQG